MNNVFVKGLFFFFCCLGFFWKPQKAQTLLLIHLKKMFLLKSKSVLEAF